MQERMIDGSYGEPRPFNKEEMDSLMEDPNVDSVEVFRNTPENLQKRQQLFEMSQSKLRKKRKINNKLQKQSRRNNR